MSVDLGNMSFLCGWYELCRLNEEVTKLSKKIQTQRATKDNFLQMAVDYLVVLTCFTGGLRNLSLCCFVTEYRPWLCCQRLSSILLKGILYNWIAKSRSLQEKWSCSTVLGHCSKTSWKFSMSGFDLWRHLPVCWNYGWRCLWRSSGQRKFFGCSCGWLGVRWEIFLRELQVTDIHNLLSYRLQSNNVPRWWFQIFVIFIPTWGNDPIWRIFFRWVETTRQCTDEFIS